MKRKIMCTYGGLDGPITDILYGEVAVRYRFCGLDRIVETVFNDEAVVKAIIEYEDGLKIELFVKENQVSVGAEQKAD